MKASSARTAGRSTSDMTRRLPDMFAGGAALALFGLSLAMFWPGFAMYDSVTQYGQAVSGVYDDWHPPAMAHVWALLGGQGAGRMLALQLGAWWLGLGGFAVALARAGRRRAAIAALVVGVLPPFLGWEAVVLKDAQMAAALVAATGLIAWRGGRRPGVAVSAAVAVLIAYATLVRANAVFATVPLVVMLAPRPAVLWGKALAVVVATLAVLAVAPAINHGPLAASPSGVERSAALYDLAGIAARSADARDTGLLPAERATIVARGCAKPFFWDPLGDSAHCGAAMARLRAEPVGRLYATLVGAAVHHPVAYAGHRLAHLNSTWRWLVPWHWPNAAPAQASEPNTVGLVTPGALAVAYQKQAKFWVETPLGWPIAWIVVAAVALGIAARRPDGATRRLAMALLVSALAGEASFAAISIASDLRYHLWSMVATALALILLADGTPVPRRWAVGGAAALAVAIGGGLAARLLLPLPPQTYQGMLG